MGQELKRHHVFSLFLSQTNHEAEVETFYFDIGYLVFKTVTKANFAPIYSVRDEIFIQCLAVILSPLLSPY